jgi:hypothetical protein
MPTRFTGGCCLSKYSAAAIVPSTSAPDSQAGRSRPSRPNGFTSFMPRFVPGQPPGSPGRRRDG